MNVRQEWFDLCLDLGLMSPTPGIMCGVYISVDDSVGFPRIAAYLRKPVPIPEWERNLLRKQAKRLAG